MKNDTLGGDTIKGHKKRKSIISSARTDANLIDNDPFTDKDHVIIQFENDGVEDKANSSLIKKSKDKRDSNHGS